MKKGYTLVEVLVVIVIIGLIASIVYPAVGKILANSRKTAYDNQVDTIIKGSKEWGYKNSTLLPGCVRVRTLLDGGYISGTSSGNTEVIVNPTDRSKNMSDGCVIITEEDNQFIYEYSDSCGECAN